MLLLRIVLLLGSVGLVAYGVYAMLVAEFIFPTFSGVENGRFVQIKGLTALFAGSSLCGLAGMTAASMVAALSRHPVREMRWQEASTIALWFGIGAFVAALLSALLGGDAIYSGLLQASEPVDIYLHPGSIE